MDGSLQAGQVFAGYEIIDLIDRGGMSFVYRARDVALGRVVALKVLTPELGEDPHFRARFADEARLASGVDHPNIIPIFSVGEEGGRLYIAMRLVPRGTDLRKHLAVRGRLAALETLSIVSQAGRALDAMHRAGLVHRDVKPDNLLLAADPEGNSAHVYVADFGLSRNGERSSVTDHGQLVGTLAYAAPEQIRGDPVDARTDVYGLGCVAFECLSGERPFVRDSDAAVMYSQLNDPPPRLPTDVPVPVGVDAVLARAMAKEPADRYASGSAFASALRSSLGIIPSTAEPALAGTDLRQRPDLIEELPIDFALPSDPQRSVSDARTPSGGDETIIHSAHTEPTSMPNALGDDLATITTTKQPASAATPASVADTAESHTQQRRGRRWLAPGAILVVIALLGAAGLFYRSRSDGPGGDPPPTSVLAVPPPPAVAGGTATVGLAALPTDWNPTHQVWDESQLLAATTVFEPLVTTADSHLGGSAEMVAAGVHPWIAEDVTANATSSEWVIHVRPGVTFHDGTALDANAVARSLEQFRGTQPFAQKLTRVSSIAATDSKTVRLVMAGNVAWPSFPATLATQVGFVVPAAMLDATPAPGSAVGSGPFRLVSTSATGEVALTRNDTYWQKGLPLLDGLTLHDVGPSGKRVDQLEKKSLDIVDLDRSALTKRENATAAITGDQRREVGRSVVGVAFNTVTGGTWATSAPGRGALALSTDRSALAEAFNVDAATSPYVIEPWKVADAKAPPFDLGAAGVERSAVPAEGSQTIAISVAPQDIAVGAALREQWSKLQGPAVDVVGQPHGADQQTALTAGAFEAAVVRYPVGSDPDPLLPRLTYPSPDAAPIPPEPVLSPTRLGPDNVVLDLLLQARSSSDPKERLKLYGEAAAAMNGRTLLPFVWLFSDVHYLVSFSASINLENTAEAFNPCAFATVGRTDVASPGR